MIAVIFGILFFVAIHYYDKSKSEQKQKEKLLEKSEFEKKQLTDRIKQIEQKQKESELKDYSKHKTDIQSLKTKVFDFKTIHFKENYSFIEYRNLKGEKYLIDRFKAMDFLEDIIFPISKEHFQISDLEYLNWLESLGEYSFYEKEQKKEFEKLDELEELDMTKIQKGKFNVLRRLDNIWYVIETIDSELNFEFSNVIKNYIQIKISPIINEKKYYAQQRV